MSVNGGTIRKRVCNADAPVFMVHSALTLFIPLTPVTGIISSLLVFDRTAFDV